MWVNLYNLNSKKFLTFIFSIFIRFTPQYKGLQAIYDKYKDQGFVILGFPCNQFGGQVMILYFSFIFFTNFLKKEPGTNGEIVEFCSKSFQVTFPLMDKVS